jgi:hypothetical protein
MDDYRRKIISKTPLNGARIYGKLRQSNTFRLELECGHFAQRNMRNTQENIVCEFCKELGSNRKI